MAKVYRRIKPPSDLQSYIFPNQHAIWPRIDLQCME